TWQQTRHTRRCCWTARSACLPGRSSLRRANSPACAPARKAWWPETRATCRRARQLGFTSAFPKNQNLEDRPLTTRKLLPYLAGTLMAASCASFAAPTEIQFWHPGLGALDEALDAQVQAFNESQPDYKVVRSARGSY